MKKLMNWAMLALLTLPMVLTSCSKDEEADASLFNKWEMSFSMNFMGMEITTITQYVFNEDKTGSMSDIIMGEVDESTDFTYEYDENTITITYTEYDEEVTDVYEYSISGSKLTLTIDGIDMVLKKK